MLSCGRVIRSKQGFALVAALSLMAFILMLILAMVTLAQVENQSSRITLDGLRAKEAARLALMMALGDLQKYAGPDQRVTARAEITGVTNNNRYWTGVWDTTDPTAKPKWLVSGDAPEPANEPPEAMQLVGSGTVGSHSNEYVNAPIIEVLSEEGAVGSKIAWWISDEGVKASVGLTDRTEALNEGFFTSYSATGLPHEEQRQILKQIGPRRHRTEILFGSDTELVPGEIEDITDSKVSEKISEASNQLRRTLNWDNLPLAKGFLQADLESNFHNATYIAKSVLTDTQNGGLKKDLSDKDYENLAFTPPIDQSLKDFLWSSGPDANGNLKLKGLSNSEINQLEDDAAVHTISPILTEVALYFAVSGQTKSSSTARAFLRLELELWSPHGFRHAYSGPSGSNTPELIVEFENLPDINLSFYDKDTEAFTNSTSLAFDDLSPSFELDLTETQKAGEIRKTIGLWPANASSPKSNFYYTNNWSWTVDDPSYNPDDRNVSFPKGDSIHYASSPANINLVLKNTDGEILQRIENIPIDSIETDFGYFEDSPSELSSIDAPIAFYYRMYDERADLEKWLSEVDPRAITIDLSDSKQSSLIDLNDIDGNDLGDADIPPPDAFTKVDLLHGQPNNNFFRLYDIPATIPYSLGVLGHLQLFNARPFSIGNAWGKDLNNIFDAFFISGIPDDPSISYWSPQLDPENNPLPNPFIEVADKHVSLSDISNEKSARYLLKIGNFNINSTSAAAWLAILDANYIYDWEYTYNKGTSTEESKRRINLEAAYCRLPFSGHYRSKSFTDWKFPFEDYEEETSVADDYPILSNTEAENIFRHSNNFNTTQDWRPSLQIGHREIGLGALTSLAESIVTRLEGRGSPFLSLSGFLNSGILQESIDDSSINTIDRKLNYNDAAYDLKIPKLAPAYLSQSDLFSAIAPFASARSDTFTIRARAETLNPRTGVAVGRASCIARVQRIPERISQDDIRMENADGFGRRFIIKEIRWVEDSEL